MIESGGENGRAVVALRPFGRKRQKRNGIGAAGNGDKQAARARMGRENLVGDQHLARRASRCALALIVLALGNLRGISA